MFAGKQKREAVYFLQEVERLENWCGDGTQIFMIVKINADRLKYKQLQLLASYIRYATELLNNKS